MRTKRFSSLMPSARHTSSVLCSSITRNRIASPASAPFAAVDIELFERAVANLVDNALKFCPNVARITLAAARRDARVEVVVADTGPGIAEADLPHLFARFFKAAPVSRRRPARAARGWAWRSSNASPNSTTVRSL